MRHAAIAALPLAGQAVVRPAVPIDPITAILDAFRTHAVVALAEGDHENNQIGAFCLALINDRRFPSVVNDFARMASAGLPQSAIDGIKRTCSNP
jgi:hypothetical protein